MLDKIEKYDINKEVKTDQLLFYGFVEEGFGEDTLNTKYIYTSPLTKKTALYVEVRKNIGKLKFDDHNNVVVYESNLQRVYNPFYADEESPELDEVIDSYNERMDDMVSSGILVKRLRNKKQG